jgi:hypothetical protein
VQQTKMGKNAPNWAQKYRMAQKYAKIATKYQMAMEYIFGIFGMKMLVPSGNPAQGQQGCQMVYFQTEPPVLVYFGRPLKGKC